MQEQRPKFRQRRPRNQYRALCVHEFNRRGSKLPTNPSYEELAKALLEHLKPVRA